MIAKVRPINDWVIVGDFGHPDRTESGTIEIPGVKGNNDARYNHYPFRFGQVVSHGPGRATTKRKTTIFRSRADGRVVTSSPKVAHGEFIPYDGPPVGSIVMYSRNHGVKFQYQVETDFGACWGRTLDQEQLIAVVDDFTPWWDVEACQVDPWSDFSN